MKKLLLIFFLFNLIQLLNTNLFSQEVPHSINNKGIYDFLDELANNHIVEINSAVKPYSRLYIANRLKEAEEKREQLNARQGKELDFYLMDFGKEEERLRAVGGGLKEETARPQDRKTITKERFILLQGFFILADC